MGTRGCLLAGTIHRSPVGPGWPNLESPQCVQSRGFAFFTVGTWVEAEAAVTLEYKGFEGKMWPWEGVVEDWREVGSDEGASTNTSSSSTGHPELRITFCAPKCLSSLDARVTSTWLGAIGSWDFLCRKSALRFKFLRCVEGLFLFTAFADIYGIFSRHFDTSLKLFLFLTKFNRAKLIVFAFSDYNFADNSNNLRSPDFQDSRF